MNSKNSTHEAIEAMLYGAIRVLENVASDQDVTLGDVNQAISDLYLIINENSSSSANSTSSTKAEADPMIFKFSDYFPKGGSNFPTGPRGAA